MYLRDGGTSRPPGVLKGPRHRKTTQRPSPDPAACRLRSSAEKDTSSATHQSPTPSPLHTASKSSADSSRSSPWTRSAASAEGSTLAKEGSAGGNPRWLKHRRKPVICQSARQGVGALRRGCPPSDRHTISTTLPIPLGPPAQWAEQPAGLASYVPRPTPAPAGAARPGGLRNCSRLACPATRSVCAVATCAGKLLRTRTPRSSIFAALMLAP
jgi:hypothetical protein